MVERAHRLSYNRNPFFFQMLFCIHNVFHHFPLKFCNERNNIRERMLESQCGNPALSRPSTADGESHVTSADSYVTSSAILDNTLQYIFTLTQFAIYVLFALLLILR